MTQPAIRRTGNGEQQVDVAAVIVRWKGGKLAERCAASLLDGTGRRPQEIVVVDSGSEDGGAERIAHSLTEVRVEALTENIGFAAAANHGVSTTNAPYILLLNPDTTIVADGLSRLVARLHAEPGLAGVVPLLENPDGTSQHRWQLRKLPTALDLSLGRSGRPAFADRPTTNEPVPQPAAAAWLVRRTVWQAMNGLDDGYRPAWWEDVDFCRRLQARLGTDGFPATAGFVVEPRARVLHRGGSSLDDLDRKAFLSAFNNNLLRYAHIHHPQSIGMIRLGLRGSNLVRTLARSISF